MSSKLISQLTEVSCQHRCRRFLNLRQLVEVAPAPPPQIIEGVLHQGCKMILGGTSKSNKSWCLLDLAVTVASGEKLSSRQYYIFEVERDLSDFAVGDHFRNQLHRIIKWFFENQ